MKVPLNCVYLNKKSKVSSREKKNKMDDFKNFISKTNNKDITVKKIIKNPNKHKKKYLETEENKSINKSLSKQVSFSKNLSTSKKKLTQSLCLESKDKNKNKNDKLHNSQSNLSTYFYDKFRCLQHAMWQFIATFAVNINVNGKGRPFLWASSV